MTRLLITCLLTVTLLTACSTKPVTPEQEYFADLYLRSEFTWWQALEENKLIVNEQSAHLELTFKVIVDGNPYHLKIADKNWSQNKNCGFISNQQKHITLGQWMPINCNFNGDISEPLLGAFVLKPQVSGEYKIQLSLQQNGKGAIRVLSPNSF